MVEDPLICERKYMTLYSGLFSLVDTKKLQQNHVSQKDGRSVHKEYRYRVLGEGTITSIPEKNTKKFWVICDEKNTKQKFILFVPEKMPTGETVTFLEKEIFSPTKIEISKKGGEVEVYQHPDGSLCEWKHSLIYEETIDGWNVISVDGG